MGGCGVALQFFTDTENIADGRWRTAGSGSVADDSVQVYIGLCRKSLVRFEHRQIPLWTTFDEAGVNEV